MRNQRHSMNKEERAMSPAQTKANTLPFWVRFDNAIETGFLILGRVLLTALLSFWIVAGLLIIYVIVRAFGG